MNVLHCPFQIERCQKVRSMNTVISVSETPMIYSASIQLCISIGARVIFWKERDRQMTNTRMRSGWRSSLGLISVIRDSLKGTVTMHIRVLFISVLLRRRKAYFQIRLTFKTRCFRAGSNWRYCTARTLDSGTAPRGLGGLRAGHEGNHGSTEEIRHGTARWPT